MSPDSFVLHGYTCSPHQALSSVDCACQVIASQRQLEAKYSQAKDTADQWYRRAQLALEKGDETLAREALSRRKAYEVCCNCMLQTCLLQHEPPAGFLACLEFSMHQDLKTLLLNHASVLQSASHGAWCTSAVSAVVLLACPLHPRHATGGSCERVVSVRQWYMQLRYLYQSSLC